jgi:lipopolysaccharide transport system permease protein
MPADTHTEMKPETEARAAQAATGRPGRQTIGWTRGERGTLRELWEYRELFYFFAWRDVKVRYKQTFLGVLWALIQPFFTMVVFTLLFGRVARIPTEGIPGPIFYLTALLPWTYFSSTLSGAGMSLISNSNLLTKIYFPRVILPAAAALSGLVDFLIACVLLAAIMAYYHAPVGWGLLLWPVLVALLILQALGVGLFLAAVNVRYRDVKYAIPFMIQLWLFVTPIIYPSSMVPEKFRWLVALNPMSGLIEAFRHTVAPGQAVNWPMLGFSAAFTIVVFAAGAAYFKRTEMAFADII